jgi:hypothetical protein
VEVAVSGGGGGKWVILCSRTRCRNNRTVHNLIGVQWFDAVLIAGVLQVVAESFDRLVQQTGRRIITTDRQNHGGTCSDDDQRVLVLATTHQVRFGVDADVLFAAQFNAALLKHAGIVETGADHLQLVLSDLRSESREAKGRQSS